MSSTADDKTAEPGLYPRAPNQIAAVAPAGESVQTVNAYELAVLSAPETQPAVEYTRSRIRMLTVLAALYLALFIAALDQYVVATAIPTITSDLHSASGYIWIGGAYLLANTAACPIWAKLSDIWGRKLILLAAVAMFFASSILCAVSTSMKMLVVGRALQGTAGGGLISLVNITISDLFSMRSRSLYLGLMEVMWALAGGIGPVLGGVLSELASWRWIFWVNLPIAGTTFVLLLIFLDVHNPRTRVVEGIKAIDWFGSLSILGLTLMLLIGLDFGGATFPWNSPTVLCLIIFGALMSLVFVYSEKYLARYPLMPLKLFSHRSNIASLVVCYLHGFVLVTEYYLPLYFQSALLSTPLHSGILSLPLAITEALTGIFSGVFIHRTGHYTPLIHAGTTLLTLGTGLYIALSASTPVSHIIAFELVAGVGAGLLFEAPLIALQVRTSQADTATATATFGFVRILSTATAVVIGGVVFQNGMDSQIPHLIAAGLPKNVTDALAGGQAAANVMVVGRIGDVGQRELVKEAFAWSMRNLWILCAALSAVGIAAGGFVAGEHLSREHVETKTGVGLGIGEVKDGPVRRSEP